MVTEELIQQEFKFVSEVYAKMSPPVRNGEGWKMDGFFDVIDANGHCWDTYEIAVLIPAGFPNELPTLKETGGKIERHEDWHNTNGNCCLSTNAIMYKELGTPISLLQWMKRFVHDFLANHIIKLKDKAYAKGEFSHGTPGIIEGYKEIFGVNSGEAVISRLNLIIGSSRLSLKQRCFCNSGKSYGECYMVEPDQHTYNIPIIQFIRDRLEITEYLKRPINERDC